MMMKTSDAQRPDREGGQAEGMAGQRSQQSTSKGQRSMTSIKQTTNNKHKKKAKAKAEEEGVITFTSQYQYRT